MIYFIDESGNTGDISLKSAGLDFSGQPIFSLACVGIEDLAALEEKISELKNKHKIRADELKSLKLYKNKIKFIMDLIEYIHLNKVPFFIEVVDKKYYIAIHIVNCFVMPPYFIPEDSKFNVLRNAFADFIYENCTQEIFDEFIKLIGDPSEDNVIFFFEFIINYFKGCECEISSGIYFSVVESLDDFNTIKEDEGDKAYKRFLPIPDFNKRGNEVWIFPHFSSFTNIYARMNLFHKTDISELTIIHDEQSHFDEIIKKAQRDAENYGGQSPNSITPNSDYEFKSSAPLFFSDSERNTGIQVADLLAGFVMRYVLEFFEGKSMSREKQDCFNMLFKSGNPFTGVGMNFVLSTEKASAIFSRVSI